MLFKCRLTKLKKIISFLNIKKIKITKKKTCKKRSMPQNRTDSWRKKMHFTNNYSNSYYIWKFNSRFVIYLLRNKCIDLGFNNLNYSSLLLKNDILLNVKNVKTLNKFFFVLLYYKNFFFFFPINLYTRDSNHLCLYFDKNNSSLEIFNFFLFWLNSSLLILVKKWYNMVFKVSFNFIFLKLKYKGKNYRWHRKKKGLVLRFGHSHLIYSKKPTSVFLKKKGRMKILFFGTNVELIYFYLRNLIKWKPSNVYTGRGLRLSRFKLLKKAGKISAYR